MEFRTYAEIDLTMIDLNFQAIKKLVGKTKIMSVVKANGYGHGTENAAETLSNSGTDYFGVANTLEAKKIRNAGSHKPILVFGNPDKYCMEDYFSFDLEAAVSDFETAEFVSFAAKRRNKKFKFILKLIREWDVMD